MYQANISDSKQETLFEMINAYFDSIRNIKIKANPTEPVQSSSKDILIIRTLESFQEELKEMSNFTDPNYDNYEIDDMMTSEYDVVESDSEISSIEEKLQELNLKPSDNNNSDDESSILNQRNSFIAEQILKKLPLLKDNESIVLKFNLL